MYFVYVAIEICKCLPLYFSKYSKKDFTIHQLFILLVLKQKSKLSYAEFLDDLILKPKVINAIGLIKTIFHKLIDDSLVYSISFPNVKLLC